MGLAVFPALTGPLDTPEGLMMIYSPEIGIIGLEN